MDDSSQSCQEHNKSLKTEDGNDMMNTRPEHPEASGNARSRRFTKVLSTDEISGGLDCNDNLQQHITPRDFVKAEIAVCNNMGYNIDVLIGDGENIESREGASEVENVVQNAASGVREGVETSDLKNERVGSDDVQGDGIHEPTADDIDVRFIENDIEEDAEVAGPGDGDNIDDRGDMIENRGGSDDVVQGGETDEADQNVGNQNVVESDIGGAVGYSDDVIQGDSIDEADDVANTAIAHDVEVMGPGDDVLDARDDMIENSYGYSDESESGGSDVVQGDEAYDEDYENESSVTDFEVENINEVHESDRDANQTDSNKIIDEGAIGGAVGCTFQDSADTYQELLSEIDGLRVRVHDLHCQVQILLQTLNEEKQKSSWIVSQFNRTNENNKVLLKENKVLDQENTNLFVQIRGLQREIQVLIKENERVLNELRECQQRNESLRLDNDNVTMIMLRFQKELGERQRKLEKLMNENRALEKKGALNEESLEMENTLLEGYKELLEGMKESTKGMARLSKENKELKEVNVQQKKEMKRHTKQNEKLQNQSEHQRVFGIFMVTVFMILLAIFINN